MALSSLWHKARGKTRDKKAQSNTSPQAQIVPIKVVRGKNEISPAPPNDNLSINAEHNSNSQHSLPANLEPTDLWRRAYEALCEDDSKRKLMRTYENAMLSKFNDGKPLSDDNREAHMLDLIKKEFNSTDKTQWMFQDGGGKGNVRRQIGNVVKVVLFATDFVNTAASMDPHTALAWAGVSVFLPILLNPVQQYEALIDCLAFVSTVICRSAAIDDLYRRQSPVNPSTSQEGPSPDIFKAFEEKLTELYSHILEFQARAACQFVRNIVVQIARDTFKVDGWENLRTKMEASEKDCQAFTNILDSQRLHDAVREQECRMEEMQGILLLQNQTFQKLLLAADNIQAEIVAAQVDNKAGFKSLEQGMDRAEQQFLLEKLPRAVGASFNARRDKTSKSSFDSAEPETCLDGTRVCLLQDIETWCVNPGGKCLFWLSGMAGTGKSTIARTVAQKLDNRNWLGASFFFSRSDGDLGHATKFFTTLAFQLANKSQMLVRYICKAIKDYGHIDRPSLKDQWKHFIYQPLSELEHSQASVRNVVKCVLVIDALDECDDDDDDVAIILQLLAEAGHFKTVQLHVFITSRPETPIRYGFRAIPEVHQDFSLRDISQTDIEHDISLFLEYELETIRKKRSLPADWPGKQNITLLTGRAEGLFIYAATACRFIGGARVALPQEQLKKILQGDTAGLSSTQRLDRMYNQILSNSLVEDDDEKTALYEQFREVVGSIILLFERLSAPALSRLLFQSDDALKNIVRPTLELLFSVLDVPDLDVPESVDRPIRLLHLSFRDFLLDKKRCTDDQLRINELKTHSDLAEHCLRVMSNSLRNDICKLQRPGCLASEVSEALKDKFLPAHVQYACRSWIDHFIRSDLNLCDKGHKQVHEFFKTHFLHWLEALSLIGGMSKGVLMITELQSTLTDNRTELFDMIYDAKRFVLNNRSIIEKGPLQVYSSALVFSPKKSVIRTQFRSQFPPWIKSLPVVEEDWKPSLQALEGHSELVWAVAFSPNGQLLASASSDHTVRLWDSKTGASRATLEGHSGPVNAVAFSPDGQLLASASNDCTVRLWDSKTGAWCITLEGHSETVRAVAFSPDGQLLASASDDYTVRLWDPKTGASRATLEGHSAVNAVAFPPDGQLLASASDDHTVRLWDPKTEPWRATLEGHSRAVNAVAFSPDGQLLASASNDYTVRLWDPKTGASCVTLEGHSRPVYVVAFSPDGQLLASASYDYTVRLWDPKTGASCATLEGHSDMVWAVAFSPDGQLLASASSGHTVRLWDLKTGASCATLKGHSETVNAVAFPPDGQLLASASDDHAVRLWDPKTGASCATLEGHSDMVWAVAFSPDGQLLASASGNHTVRLWDIKTRDTIQIFDVEGHINELSFSSDGPYLKTNRGVLELSSLVYNPSQPQTDYLTHLYVREQWVAWNQNDILWLPPDYRATCVAVQNDMVALGHVSGRVTFIEFDRGKMASSAQSL